MTQWQHTSSIDSISQAPMYLPTVHIGKAGSYLFFLIEINFTENAEQGLDSSNNVRKRATLSFYPKQYKLDCAIPLISSLQLLPDLIITESARDE